MGLWQEAPLPASPPSHDQFVFSGAGLWATLRASHPGTLPKLTLCT